MLFAFCGTLILVRNKYYCALFALNDVTKAQIIGSYSTAKTSALITQYTRSLRKGIVPVESLRLQPVTENSAYNKPGNTSILPQRNGRKLSSPRRRQSIAQDHGKVSHRLWVNLLDSCCAVLKLKVQATLNKQCIVMLGQIIPMSSCAAHINKLFLVLIRRGPVWPIESMHSGFIPIIWSQSSMLFFQVDREIVKIAELSAVGLQGIRSLSKTLPLLPKLSFLLMFSFIQHL